MNQFSENAARLELMTQASGLADGGLDPLYSATLSMRWSRSGDDGLLLVSASDCASELQVTRTKEADADGADGLDEDEGAYAVEVPPLNLDRVSWHRCDDEQLAGVHGGLYQHRADAGAIALVAAPHAATLACSRDVQLDGIPFFHPMVALGGRDRIDCCHPGFYAALLAGEPLDGIDHSPLDMLLEALGEGRACLVAHYGLLALGDSPRAAARLARQLEALCCIYWQVLQLGRPAAMPIVTG